MIFDLHIYGLLNLLVISEMNFETSLGIHVLLQFNDST